MYIGGTDDKVIPSLSTLEILDNSMDEAIAGHADLIKISLLDNNTLQIEDNGRGIPIDDHPKFPGKSALEIIVSTLHAGGKFSMVHTKHLEDYMEWVFQLSMLYLKI